MARFKFRHVGKDGQPPDISHLEAARAAASRYDAGVMDILREYLEEPTDWEGLATNLMASPAHLGWRANAPDVRRAGCGDFARIIREAFGLQGRTELFWLAKGGSHWGVLEGDGSIHLAEELTELDEPRALLQVLAHEVRHELQKALILDKVQPSTAAEITLQQIWSDALKNYPRLDLNTIPTAGDALQYEVNPLERDAIVTETSFLNAYSRLNTTC